MKSLLISPPLPSVVFPMLVMLMCWSKLKCSTVHRNAKCLVCWNVLQCNFKPNPPLAAPLKADPADFCPAQLPCCCCCCCQLHVLQPTTCAALLLQPTVCAAIGCSEVHWSWSCIGHHVFHWAVLILQAESYVQCDSMEWRRGECSITYSW